MMFFGPPNITSPKTFNGKRLHGWIQAAFHFFAPGRCSVNVLHSLEILCNLWERQAALMTEKYVPCITLSPFVANLLPLSAAAGFCLSSQSLYNIHWSDLFAAVKIWVVTGSIATSWNWL
jgi:hypothetical protein